MEHYRDEREAHDEALSCQEKRYKIAMLNDRRKSLLSEVKKIDSQLERYIKREENTD